MSLLLLPENKLLNQLEKVLVPVDAVAEGVVDAAAAAAAVDEVDEEDLKSPNKLLQKLEVLVDVALGLAAATFWAATVLAPAETTAAAVVGVGVPVFEVEVTVSQTVITTGAGAE